MSEKYLRVTMPDGTKWDVPARVIAENRAEVYRHEGDYEGEVAYALGDEYELTEWAANNMNWSDVEAVAKRVPFKRALVDYQEGWVNGEKEVIER